MWKDNIKLYLAEDISAIWKWVDMVQDCVHSSLMGFQIPASSVIILFYLFAEAPYKIVMCSLTRSFSVQSS